MQTNGVKDGSTNKSTVSQERNDNYTEKQKQKQRTTGMQTYGNVCNDQLQNLSGFAMWFPNSHYIQQSTKMQKGQGGTSQAYGNQSQTGPREKCNHNIHFNIVMLVIHNIFQMAEFIWTVILR